MGRLTDRSVKSAGEGKHVDGDGLQLVVSKTGKRKWVLRYQTDGARRDMGLGSYPSVSLLQARSAAADARKLIAQGIDPLQAKQAARKAEKPIPTFEDIAKLVIADAQSKSTNAKVQYQWGYYLGPVYCGPLLSKAVHEITTVDVAAVLRVVWDAKPEIARKLYPAIRRVFEHARILLRDEHGISMPDNPARWDDLKAMGFRAPTRLSQGSHASLSYNEAAAFLVDLQSRDAMSARAFEFLILTNVRTDAVLKTRWDEIDLAKAVWTVLLKNLKDRLYRKESFRVPLSKAALALLKTIFASRTSEYVFPSHRSDRPLSNMAMLTLLKRMNGEHPRWIDVESKKSITPHGFRATFRTWAEETTGFPHAVIEEAMGHQVGTRVERVYRRTDVLEKRRELMEAWAQYCEAKTGKVVSMARAAR